MLGVEAVEAVGVGRCSGSTWSGSSPTEGIRGAYSGATIRVIVGRQSSVIWKVTCSHLHHDVYVCHCGGNAGGSSGGWGSEAEDEERHDERLWG